MSVYFRPYLCTWCVSRVHLAHLRRRQRFGPCYIGRYVFDENPCFRARFYRRHYEACRRLANLSLYSLKQKQNKKTEKDTWLMVFSLHFIWQRSTLYLFLKFFVFPACGLVVPSIALRSLTRISISSYQHPELTPPLSSIFQSSAISFFLTIEVTRQRK